MDHHPKFNDWLMLLLLALIWGSSFILMKEGLKAFRPEEVATLRIVITAIVLVPFAITRMKTVTRKKTGVILLQGLFGNFLPAFLFTAAQSHIESSIAGILNSLSSVWVLIIGLLFFNAPFKLIRVIGILFALGGAVMLVLLQPSHGATSNSMFSLLIVVATISYGLAANITKKYLHDVHPITIVSISFSIVLIPFLIYLFSTDFISVMKSNPQADASLGFITVLACMGSALASVIFNRLIHRTSTLFASSVVYLIPIVALFWGMLDGEVIQMIDFAGMGLIFLGVYLISR